MNKEKLVEVLDLHIKYLHGVDGGKRADLRGASLQGAYLRGAYLRGADLRGADLQGAYLQGAYLRGADLRDADLHGAYLHGAYLRDADLRGTSIDSRLLNAQRTFCKACPPNRQGGRIVYRTAQSQHIGSTRYKPGTTHVASILSFDAATACHPGIYAASLGWMRLYYEGVQLVRCYVRDGEWTITAKGAIRCKRLRVLSEVLAQASA